MKSGVRWLRVFLPLLLAVSAQAADKNARADKQAPGSMESRAKKDLRYLEPKSLSAVRLLPAPPSLGSEEYKAEIEEILALQAARTPAQIQRFQSEEKLGLATFATVLPGGCTSDDLPKLEKLLKAAADDSKHFGEAAKLSFQRKRPYWEDNRIQPLGERSEEFAYPSGHATRGIILATILAQLEPGRADKLMERGREIGWDRVIGGVHHPSDIAAGRVLGQAIAQALLRNPNFQADLKAVKEEYQDFKKTTAPALGAK